MDYSYRYLKSDWGWGMVGGSEVDGGGWKGKRLVAIGLLMGGVASWLLLVVPLWEFRWLYATSQQRFVLPVSSEVEVRPYERSERSGLMEEVFPEVANLGVVKTSEVSYYSLSIPELGIKRARVKVGGDDLSESLVHYGGTAVPGKVGTSVVFGHSVLPQFFDPEDYMTIFSTLHRLREGAEVVVDFDGIEYRYQVVGKEVVEPDDFRVLDQAKDDSYLLLITCTPPGTYWKRLVVKAKLLPWE